MRRIVVALLIHGVAAPLAAQGPRGIEVGVAAVATDADPAFLGGGLSVGYRPGGRVRLATNLLAGDTDGFTGRGELVGHYLMLPGKLTGLGPYSLGGIAGEVGGRNRGFLVLGLGLEWRPGAGNGWYLETSGGGGPRLALGWRWRRLRPQRRG